MKFWEINIGSITAILTIGIPAWWGLFTMKVILKDYIPHKHGENSGMLHAENISYPRSLLTREK